MRCARPSRDHAPRQWAGLKFFNVYGPNEGHKGGMKSVVAQIWPKVAAGEPVQPVPLAPPRLRRRRPAARLRLVDDVVDIIDWLL